MLSESKLEGKDECDDRLIGSRLTGQIKIRQGRFFSTETQSTRSLQSTPDNLFDRGPSRDLSIGLSNKTKENADVVLVEKRMPSPDG